MPPVDQEYISLLQLPKHPFFRKTVGDELDRLSRGDGSLSPEECLADAIRSYLPYLFGESNYNPLEDFRFLEQHVIGMIASIPKLAELAETIGHPSIIDNR